MTDERIEPTLDLPSSDPHEYFIYRPDTDPAKLAMGVHPAGVPFRNVEFNGNYFYVIKDELWQKGETSVDSKGLFVVFFRLKGEFKGYGV